jgi:dihydroorotate dehydrogenase (fumarate)
MDLSTTYLGLRLRSPLVPSASPLSQNPDNIKRMEDAGAGAIVFHSLFEEQIRGEEFALHHHLNQGTESYAEALTYVPQDLDFKVGPDAYLEHLAKAKAAVQIPIIGSLNGSSPGGWVRYARQIQEAGADALELNIYNIPTDFSLNGAEIEQNYIDILRAVKEEITIPVSVKLSPFFTNFSRFALSLDQTGAEGLVLFNRFYQPDIDLETLGVSHTILFSTPMAMRLPLRWIAILSGHLRASLAATSGIHRATDAIKMLMVGADVTMLCSVLLRRGIDHLRLIELEICAWMEEHEYDSINQLKGSLSRLKCPDPSAFERAQYVETLAISSDRFAVGLPIDKSDIS